MKITVRYFASLRERMGCDENMLELESQLLSVDDLWQRHLATEPLPPNILIAVNMEYARPTHVLMDGDEVAFFPPVTGG